MVLSMTKQKVKAISGNSVTPAVVMSNLFDDITTTKNIMCISENTSGTMSFAMNTMSAKELCHLKVMMDHFFHDLLSLEDAEGEE